jgi:hypothetical protein
MRPANGAQGNARPAARRPAANSAGARANGGDPLREVAAELKRFSDFASLYAHAKRDRLRLAVRDAIWRLTARVATIGAAVGFALIASVYVFEGAVRGLTIALQDRAWLASLIVGLSAWLVIAGIVFVGRRVTRTTEYHRRVADYEARNAEKTDRIRPSDEAPDDAQRAEVPSGTNSRRSGRHAASAAVGTRHSAESA